MTLLLALALGPAGAAGESHRGLALEQRQVLLKADGNELVVRRQAPVPYADLVELVTAIEHPLPPPASALHLRRQAPPQAIDYVLAVTREGRLVVGQQLRSYDFAARRYAFTRGEIARSYSPLERPGPWTWLVEVMLSRERPVTLELQAETGWPVKTVTINSVGTP